MIPFAIMTSYPPMALLGRLDGQSVLTSLLTALRAAGGEPADLASLTIYIVDMEDYKAHGREIGRVWKRLVGTHYPATAGIGVARLWDVEALVEVQGMVRAGVLVVFENPEWRRMIRRSLGWK